MYQVLANFKVVGMLANQNEAIDYATELAKIYASVYVYSLNWSFECMNWEAISIWTSWGNH